MTILTHSNISIRLPKTHAELIVKAAIEAREELSKWVASRALAAACAELGVPEPAPEPPSKDRLRQAARALGMSEESFKAKVLFDAVSRALEHRTPTGPVMRDAGDTEPPPAMPEVKKAKSGEHRLDLPDLSTLTPAQAVRVALGQRAG
jgi:hypothetical protein